MVERMNRERYVRGSCRAQGWEVGHRSTRRGIYWCSNRWPVRRWRLAWSMRLGRWGDWGHRGIIEEIWHRHDLNQVVAGSVARYGCRGCHVGVLSLVNCGLARSSGRAGRDLQIWIKSLPHNYWFHLQCGSDVKPYDPAAAFKESKIFLPAAWRVFPNSEDGLHYLICIECKSVVPVKYVFSPSASWIAYAVNTSRSKMKTITAKKRCKTLQRNNLWLATIGPVNTSKLWFTC